jgi:hypothetical protein
VVSWRTPNSYLTVGVERGTATSSSTGPGTTSGRAVLGGCAIDEGLPTHSCPACGGNWGSLEFGTATPSSAGFWDELDALDDKSLPGDAARQSVTHIMVEIDKVGCLRGEASRRVGVPAWRLKEWHERSREGDQRFDPAAPSAFYQVGTLRLNLYTPADLASLAVFAEPEGATILNEDMRLVGWRYEWDHLNERYVTTDYLTTDESYSYAVTRIDWLGRSGRGYKVWSTESGTTQAMFSTWGEARRHALHLASGGHYEPQPDDDSAVEGAGEDEPAHLLERPILPTEN